MLDNLQEGDELPFWAHLWDSARGLSRYVEMWTDRAARPAQRMKLLELGCGVGAVGCAAAALGWQVTMTDYQLPALHYAARNLEANGLTANLVLADWRQFAIDASFDLVVGSDVLYESTLHPALHVLLARLNARGAALALADPGRGSALNFAANREQEEWGPHLELYDGCDGPIAVYSWKTP